MINKIKTLISLYMNSNIDLSSWRTVRERYFWASYYIFYSLANTLLTNENGISLISDEVKEEFSEITIDTKNIQVQNSDELAALYQTYLSEDYCINNNEFIFIKTKDVRDNLGSYYTPCELADVIIQEVFNKLKLNETAQHQIIEKKIVDLSCGAGDFIITFLDICKSKFNKSVFKAICKNIYCYDIDPIALLILKIRLIEKYKNIKLIKNIYLCNSITKTVPSLHEVATGRLYAEGKALDVPKFDIIIGNPPWEKIRFEEKKFLNHYCPNCISKSDVLNILSKQNTDNYKYFLSIKNDIELLKKQIKTERKYVYTTVGELNTYALFAELSINSLNKNGIVCLILKSSLFKTPTYKSFFHFLMKSKYIDTIYLFKNTKKIFNIDSREEFCVTFFKENKEEEFYLGTGLTSPEDIKTVEVVKLNKTFLKKCNPLTEMIPNIESKKDMSFLEKIYSLKTFDEYYPYCNYGRLVHLTNHSQYIQKEKTNKNIPIYEGKFIELYTGNYATFNGLSTELKYKNKASALPILDPYGSVLPEERYFINIDFWKKLSTRYSEDYFICWRSLTSATNRRTMLATLLPFMPTCQSIQFLQTKSKKDLIIILALFNSVVFDYIVRLKMAGLDLTQTIVRQIPIPSPDCFLKEIIFKGIKASYYVHILSRIKFIYKNEIRLTSFFSNLSSYNIENLDIKTAISEIDMLIAKLYEIDKNIFFGIIETFSDFYSGNEKKYIYNNMP